MASKSKAEAQLKQELIQYTNNPLLVALQENDKKNLFHSNVQTAFMKTGFPLFDYYFGSVINIHDETGNIIRQEPRVGQAAGTFNLIIGNTGSGKAQPLSTPIPTPTGYRTMGSLKVGDLVFDYQGKPVQVKGVYPQGVQGVYTVYFSDHRKASCTLDHLWTVCEMDEHTKGHTTVTLPLKDIITGLQGGKQYEVPYLQNAVQYQEQDIPVHPYILGYLLCRWTVQTETVRISETYVPFLERDYAYISATEDGIDVSIPMILEMIPELQGLTREELIIPDAYLYNTAEVREWLLRGFMDRSGVILDYETLKSVASPEMLQSVIALFSKKLAEQLSELVQSLGMSILPDPRTYPEPQSEFHRLILQYRLDDIPRVHYSLGDRLLASASAQHRGLTYEAAPSVYITKIEYSHREECQCIMVDSSMGLYLTDQFVITHNTTLGAQISGNIIRQHPYANVIHYDCENRTDISRCETITKLPSYYFNGSMGPERYMLRNGRVSLEVIQEMIVKLYATKMRMADQLMMVTTDTDEFMNPIRVLQPTIIIIDSITSVINETFSPDSSKDVQDLSKMRSNMEGARDAKTLKGFFKVVLPLCKEANITIYGINHINKNVNTNSFLPVQKQQNFLKQDEAIPGGATMLYYPYNIIKLVSKPSDNFTDDTDGFTGHMVMFEPIKSSSNQSGNNSKGISFEMVFSQKNGFDSLRSLILYGRDHGLIEGNKPKMRFKGDDSFTFNWKHLNEEVKKYPIWEQVNALIVPTLREHLSFIDPLDQQFDDRSLMY